MLWATQHCLGTFQEYGAEASQRRNCQSAVETRMEMQTGVNHKLEKAGGYFCRAEL